jgi:GT2 family glycosyltransferase
MVRESRGTSVSVVTVAYQSGDALTRLLASLGADGGALETIIVDNDEGGEEIDKARAIQGARVISPGTNLGFAAACNLGAREASGEVLLFLNPDTVVVPGAVSALAKVLEAPDVGIAMPRLRLLDRPELLNSGGNVVHVTGLAWAGRYESPADEIAEVEEVPYASGAALALRAQLFRELGGFTEELFMYQEDLELSWRARLRGLRIVVVPGADVYHEYEFERNLHKRYLLERNRLVFVLTAYSGRLLGVLAPVLISAELGLVVLAAKQGWLRDKLGGWRWLASHRAWLHQHRAETQRLRTADDRELAGHLTPVLDPKMLALPRVVTPLNALVSGYWRLARRLL